MHLLSPTSDRPATTNAELVRRARPLLGTTVEIAVDPDSSHLIDAAFDVVSHIHSRMSFHEDSSDIGALSRASPGDIVDVDRATVEVLRIASQLHLASGGLFDVAVGRSLVKSGFLPRQAKGYAVDKAVECLVAAGAKHGIVNAGGDLRVFGDHTAAVEIRQGSGKLSSSRILRDVAIANSENTRSRRMHFGRLRTPHIRPDGNSVCIDQTISVVAGNCAIADAMTKVAMLDSDLANRLLRDYDGYVIDRPKNKTRRASVNARSARLARWQTQLFTTCGAALWISGVAWLMLHYFGQVQGKFGVETHPLENGSLRLHGLALIPVLLGIGGLFVVHMPVGWKDSRQRASGLILATLLGVLTISGYLLYYGGNDSVRAGSSVIHWMLGLGVPLIFVWHQALRRRARTARACQ